MKSSKFATIVFHCMIITAREARKAIVPMPYGLLKGWPIRHKEKSVITKFFLVSSTDDLSPIKTTKGKKRQRITSSSSGSESDIDTTDVKLEKRTCTSNQKSVTLKLANVCALRDEVTDEVPKKKEENENENTQFISQDDAKHLEKEAETLFHVECENGDKHNSIDSFKKPVAIETFDPTSTKYHPILNACWRQGEKVPYYALAKTFQEIERVSARLKMIDILSNFLRSVVVLTPDDLLSCIYLSLNKLGPAYEGLELGLAEQTLIRAISQSTGRTVTQIRNEIHEVGDLGIVAERSRTSQKLMFQPAPLTVNGVFNNFSDIANMTGKTSVNKKITMVGRMFTACRGPEARFLMRSLNGKLRIGLAEQSVLQALAVACATTPPGQQYPPKKINLALEKSSEAFKATVDELALILKTTYCECPNYGLLVPALLKDGIRALPNHCRITPGLPVKPMLAQPTKGVQEVLTRFDGLEFTCEWKYDGERAQIHYSENGTVNIYSRNQEDNTSKYPDIISRINKTVKQGVRSFILDCEAVAWDKENSQIMPFQVLSTRKRKDASESEIKVAVCVFMFDLLYLNGKSLVKEKFIYRRQLLHDHFKEVPGEWAFARSMDSSKMEEVQEFLEESIKGNCEGLMVKTLTQEATYEIAKRSRNWLKLKKDYLEGVGDTLDLVVLGGYLGKGKRTGTYGGFLIGCYDNDNDEYQSICKIGTGFSDESLAQHTEFFKSHVIHQAPSYYQYDVSLEPDHWFQPIQVWETKCADFSLSPIHRAAIGVVDPEKGISLRFPRFLRIREDKKPEEATTSQQIIDLYNSQEQVKNQYKYSKIQEEDFY
ncbi:tRNA ligase [Polyplax serrata]|uniref:DNA ligase n=1 Tax=Polyplax serrata TaxID=468196 RepID=A0AAN8PWQ1_POLSC